MARYNIFLLLVYFLVPENSIGSSSSGSYRQDKMPDGPYFNSFNELGEIFRPTSNTPRSSTVDQTSNFQGFLYPHNYEMRRASTSDVPLYNFHPDKTSDFPSSSSSSNNPLKAAQKPAQQNYGQYPGSVSGSLRFDPTNELSAIMKFAPRTGAETSVSSSSRAKLPSQQPTRNNTVFKNVMKFLRSYRRKCSRKSTIISVRTAEEKAKRERWDKLEATYYTAAQNLLSTYEASSKSGTKTAEKKIMEQEKAKLKKTLHDTDKEIRNLYKTFKRHKWHLDLDEDNPLHQSLMRT